MTTDPKYSIIIHYPACVTFQSFPGFCEQGVCWLFGLQDSWGCNPWWEGADHFFFVYSKLYKVILKLRIRVNMLNHPILPPDLSLEWSYFADGFGHSYTTVQNTIVPLVNCAVNSLCALWFTPTVHRHVLGLGIFIESKKIVHSHLLFILNI